MAPPISDIAASLKSLSVRRALWLNRGRSESSETPSHRTPVDLPAVQPSQQSWTARLAGANGFKAR